MKKVLLLLFLLLPLAAFGQTIDVWDGSGPNQAADIDTQADTTSYTGNWSGTFNFWDIPGEHERYWKLELFETTDTQPIYTEYDPVLNPEMTMGSTVITQGELGQPLELGKTYYLQVSAIGRDPGPPVVEYVIAAGYAMGKSDGVTIEGEEPPPEEEGGATLSLSASPSSLTFSAGVDARNLQLQISASGAGSVEVTSIREDRTYTLWGEERGFSDSLDLTVPGGSSQTISRPVTLSTLERAKALGAGTEGSFILSYVVSGQDTWGNPVSGTLAVQVAVSGAPASTLNVQGVSVQLPDSPYFRGEAVVGSTITAQATGSGTVLGQVYVDDSLAWSCLENEFNTCLHESLVVDYA